MNFSHPLYKAMDQDDNHEYEKQTIVPMSSAAKVYKHLQTLYHDVPARETHFLPNYLGAYLFRFISCFSEMRSRRVKYVLWSEWDSHFVSSMRCGFHFKNMYFVPHNFLKWYSILVSCLRVIPSLLTTHGQSSSVASLKLMLDAFNLLKSLLIRARR